MPSTSKDLLKVGIVILALILVPAITSHGQSANYIYDNLNRLIRVEYGDGTAIEYTYDGTGNRLTKVISETVPPVTTASPPGGTYSSAQSVTLTCNDGAGSGCDKIYYTTDGSTPTTSSPIYSSPINISVDTTLKFFAKDLAGNSESVRTAVYTIDTVAPSGTVIVNGGATFTNSTNVTLTLTCSDPSGCSQMQLSNDNITYSSPEPYVVTTTWSLSSGDGNKTVYVRFKDTPGNWSVPYKDTIFLDSACSNPPVRIGAIPYSTLQEAYDSASNGNTIQSRVVRFTENLTINKDISITLQGGYDCNYSTYSGNTTSIKGAVTTATGGGTATIRNFILEK